jgi:acyl-CoA synthetase (AMP-forming)/AMP-acid ligase II
VSGTAALPPVRHAGHGRGTHGRSTALSEGPSAETLTWAPRSPLDLLERRSAEAPDAELVRFADGVPLSVGQLDEGARAVARRLAPLAGAGARVASCLRPGRAGVELMFGLARLGAVEVPLALDITADAARSVLAAASVDVLVVGSGALAANAGLAALLAEAPGPAAGSVPRVVLVAEPGAPAPGGFPLIDELPGAAPGGFPARPAPQDPFVIVSTSGTTGRAKAAVLPGFAAVRHAWRVCATMGYGPGDVLLNVFPWNHINVRHSALLAALHSGARLVALPRFSASEFWADCRRGGVTAFNFMGAMLAILERRPPGPGDREHRVRMAYGAPAPVELAARFADRFGVRALEAYACTELGDVAANTPSTWRPGSAGRVVPEYEVAILDEAGRALPVGEVGQIAARPRRAGITFSEYAGDPEATARVRRDGWFLTGDHGCLDADGYLYFRGRRSDVVRRRGENVATWDVERVVAAMPGVLDVAAVGVPSELTEEELLVVLSVPPGARVDGASVRAWCQARLPRHAVPRFVRMVPELPRNPNGKLLKRVLAEHGVDEATWDADATA